MQPGKNAQALMFKFGVKYDYRGPDFAGNPVPAAIFYEEITCKHWWETLWVWRKTVNVYILEGVKFTTIRKEPFRSNQAKITIDGQDVYEMLEDRGIKGLVKLRCAATHNSKSYTDNGFVCLTDADCRLRLGFTHKKSAMMAKLIWGGSRLNW